MGQPVCGAESSAAEGCDLGYGRRDVAVSNRGELRGEVGCVCAISEKPCLASFVALREESEHAAVDVGCANQRGAVVYVVVVDGDLLVLAADVVGVAFSCRRVRPFLRPRARPIRRRSG